MVTATRLRTLRQSSALPAWLSLERTCAEHEGHLSVSEMTDHAQRKSAAALLLTCDAALLPLYHA